MRIATKGNKKVAAKSYAPSVGTKMPSSGVRPCASADCPPPMPLISAKASTAVIKACPTNGPIMSSKIQNARDARNSRRSLPSSSLKLGERKEDLLEPCIRSVRAQSSLLPQLLERAFADFASTRKQDQPIADFRRIIQLMDGHEDGSPLRCVIAQELHHVACLPQVEAIKWFIHHE